ncbi:MAG: alpha/beta fold hydrolase [Planctomycetes bacterium]|nr:alpha/beta fold hydrolase [Planctomycetota bacterium]
MKRISVNDTQLNVLDAGHGPPLLLVHGFPLDHSMWARQIEDLSGDFRVIAPDLRGFGSSDVTHRTVSMEQFADDLAALLDAVGVTDKATLCGLSMGGYVAWQFWRRHRSRLNGLILCDTRAEADAPEAARARLVSADRAIIEGVGFLADSMIEKLFAPSTLRDRPDIVEGTRSIMLATSPAGAAAAFRGMAARRDSSEILSEIDVPTLVICGEHDVISPVDEMRGIAQRIAGAAFVEIADAGHMSPLEKPREVSAAIGDFLARIA